MHHPPLNRVLRRYDVQARGFRRFRRSPSNWRIPFGLRIPLLFQCLIGTTSALVFITAVSRPSYPRRPAHYDALKRIELASKHHGRANPENEKTFIASSIYDKSRYLVNGAWRNALLDLIDLLGKDNVFLLIHQNDSSQEAEDAVSNFKARLSCSMSSSSNVIFPWKLYPLLLCPTGRGEQSESPTLQRSEIEHYDR